MAKSSKISTAPRFKSDYNKRIKAELKEALKLDNINEAPKLSKIVINVGLGKQQSDKRAFEVAKNTIRKITGQQPVETAARMSIASFKLREGSKIGVMVTLRGDRMYEFLDRLITIVLPRLRDFRGVSAGSFDKSGNYSIGFKEQSVFPELTYEETTLLHGLQVNIVIDNKEASHAKALLTAFGMPFEKNKENKLMPKKSSMARDLKRQKMIMAYAQKRAELKAAGDLEGLHKLPRNSSPTRWKNRCSETGRPRAYMRTFGLSRNSFREHASKGEIPGITKASW